MLSDKTRDEALSSWVRDLTDIPATEPQDDDNYDQVSYILKQVFESGKEEAFSESLTQYVTRKNNEIEKVCGLHYQVRCWTYLRSDRQDSKMTQGICTIHWSAP
jgi:hypothetical protein